MQNLFSLSGSSQIDVKARQSSQAVIPDLIRNPAFLNPLTALDSGYKHAGMTVGPFWQDWRFVTLIRDEPKKIEQAKLLYEMLNHWQHVHLLEPSLKLLHNASFPNV